MTIKDIVDRSTDYPWLEVSFANEELVNARGFNHAGTELANAIMNSNESNARELIASCRADGYTSIIIRES